MGKASPVDPTGLILREPQRCHIVAVRTVTMSHRCGWRRRRRCRRGAAGGAGGARGAGGVRAEPPPGRPLHSPAWQLAPEEPCHMVVDRRPVKGGGQWG